MKPYSLIAQFDSLDELKTALQVLDTDDFTAEEVSIVTTVADLQQNELQGIETSAEDSPPSTQTVAVSTIAGGTLGAALGTMTMVGPLLVAGPLAGMVAGAVGGGILNAINRWGVREDLAAHYENAIRDGGALLIVLGDEIRLDDAERLLKTIAPESMERFAPSS